MPRKSSVISLLALFALFCIVLYYFPVPCAVDELNQRSFSSSSLVQFDCLIKRRNPFFYNNHENSCALIAFLDIFDECFI